MLCHFVQIFDRKAFKYAFVALVDGAILFRMVSRLKVAGDVITRSSDFRPVWFNRECQHGGFIGILTNIDVFFATIKVTFLPFAGPKTFDGRIISSE